MFRLTRCLVDVHVVRGRLGGENGAAHIARREEPCDASGSGYGQRGVGVPEGQQKDDARMEGNSALRAVKKSCQRYGYLFRSAMVSVDGHPPRVQRSDAVRAELTLTVRC